MYVSYYYICVLIYYCVCVLLLCVSSYTTMYVSYYYMCPHILLCMCPTTIYVSSYSVAMRHLLMYSITRPFLGFRV